jgi:alkylation response protein AidB-like acyl-CoA dehydrogenase
MTSRRAALRRDLGRIGFSEEQGELLELAQRFCRERSPIATVRRLMTDELGYDPAVWREMGELGWLGIAIPEPHGGSGLGLEAVVPVAEQLGRTLLATPFLPTTLAAQAILAGGTLEQRERLLPRLALGAPASLALLEESADWTPEAVACTAEDDGDHLVLSGRKLLVEYASSAELILATVRHRGAPAWVILERSDIPPSALRREVLVDETRRSFGLNLGGLKVSRSQLMDPARAAAALERVHLAANLLLSAEMCGGARAVIDLTVDYLKTRKQFGKLIGSYQALKHPTVEAYVRYEQARSHLYSAAHSFDEQGASEIAVRMAKATADWAFSFAADRAIQFHGGFGFTYDCDAQLYRRRAIWCASQHGDGAWHKRKLADLLL